MPATTSYPCVTEKQIFLNGNAFNSSEQQALRMNGFEVAATAMTQDAHNENFKSIMIIDVLNRLCPQLNSGHIEMTNKLPTCMTLAASTTTTTTTTTATTIKIPSPCATLSTLTTSNVKRLNSYFMQQNSVVQPNSTAVDKEIMKFKNFKDINNRLYSLRQFYETRQPSGEENGVKCVVVNKKLEESKAAVDSLILSSTETKNDTSSNSLTTKPSSKCNNIIRFDNLESFEEKVVNDLDSILSSISMNDYKVPDDRFHSNSSTSDSSSSSSSTDDSDDSSCSESENGDQNDGVDSKFRFELECNNEEKENDNDAKEFDVAVQRQDQFEAIFNLVLHRLPGENLGLELRVEQDGILKVAHVLPNSAAECASDCHGNSCPIRENDEIIEINGVSLLNLAKDEILSIVKELPLYVTVMIRRHDNGSPLPIGIKSVDLDFSGHITPNTADIKIPMGLCLHTVYLSSLESKCIMPDDLNECTEIEGLFKMQRSTLQIGEEDHLQKGDIIYNINGEYYKNKFDIISRLGSLSGIAEISVLRKSNANGCYGATLDEVPYCNSIFAQNSIKLAMRRYEKPGLKSNSDAEVAYTISERGSAEPPESETQLESSEQHHHACTQTTLVNDECATTVHATFYEERPTLREIDTVLDDKQIQVKVKPKANSEPTTSSICDDNWIICGKRFNTGENNTASEKFQRTSSIFLNNDFSNNEQTDVPQNTGVHVTTMEVYTTNNPDTDGNYYFTEDATLRTLTNSSCHSDRSLVQLNLVCCEIDQSKDEIERESSRISEEEEEGEVKNGGDTKNKASDNAINVNDIMSPDSLHQPHYYKCSLNQDSVALKSYSHLPSSSCSSSVNNEHLKSSDSCAARNYVNTCKIELSSSKKELNLGLIEKNEECNSQKKLQEEELSKILKNMIHDIDERSRTPSMNGENDVEMDETSRKNKTAILIEKLNAGMIGTVIYENRVDAKPVNEPCSKGLNLEVEMPNKLFSQSGSSLSSPHQMKTQVQLELLQLVNGATKGKKTKLASMIQRIQNQDGKQVEANANNEDRKSTPTPPPPPPMQSLNETKKTVEESPQAANIIEKSSKASDKFSALVCPQPFNLQKSHPIKKTFSLQQPSFNSSQNSILNKHAQKDVTPFAVKHSISFNSKSESKGETGESTIDYVDSAFEKEIKQQKFQQPLQVQNCEPPVKATPVEPESDALRCTPAAKVSSVKDKILLFTKNKRPSFHSKRQQSQFVIDTLNNPVISRKPSYTKPTIGSSPFKKPQAAANQPTQLILPDLGGLSTEPKSTPKPKRLSPTTSIKEPAKIQPEAPKSPKTEFKSVRDKVAYFSSRVNDKDSSTSNLNTLARTSAVSITKPIESSKKVATNQPPPQPPQQQQQETTPKDKLSTASSSNICKYSSFANKNSSLNKGVVAPCCSNNSKNTTPKLEVKNVLCSKSNENKISNLIQRFTKRK